MKDLRAACRLAVEVAWQGEQADPVVPAPPPLRPLLRFARLSGPAYATVIRTVDDDETFRSRVADAAPPDAEAGLGRVGWLWLTRPPGWEQDLSGSVVAESGEREQSSTGRLRRERDGAQAAAVRARRDLATSEQGRLHAQGQLAEEQSAREALETELAALQAAHDQLRDQRNDAVRQLKDVERSLATSRHDLRIARAAARQAEAELVVRPNTAGAGDDAERAARADGQRGELHRRAGRAVAEAAEAAAALQQALGTALVILDPGPDATGGTANGTGQRGNPGTQHRSGRAIRALPVLAPGLLRGTREANRLILRSGNALVVIDGYNLARTAWQGIEPEQERRRTVAMVDEFGARSGAPVRLVFDGADDAVAPPASRTIQVQFSAGGQTADDAILDLLEALPPEQALVVVSSDRKVFDGARAAGSEAMTSEAFLAAIGR